ncbi:MAG: transposase [Oscillibacter sp.]|nr:transposase [Oscillibacter sp.]
METKLSAGLLERAGVIMKMKACGLSLDWLRGYSIPCLTFCCDRMEESLSGVSITDTALQRELIQNRGFAAWLARLLPLLPEEPPPEPKPAYSSYGSRNYYPKPTPPKNQPSRRSVLTKELCGLVETCTASGKDITAYSQEDVMQMLEQNHVESYDHLVYLENFASAELSEEMRQRVLVNICRCVSLPPELTDRQKALIVEPYVATRPLFMSAPLDEILELLEEHPGLLDIVQLLHENDVLEELDLDDYRVLAQDESGYHRLLESLISLIAHSAVNDSMRFWKKGGCQLRELRTIEAQARKNPELDWSERLSTYAGYVNQLYGSRFKNIDLGSARDYQEDILIYAIVNNKKHFIRLVDACAEAFLDLSSTSILFQEELYREHFNLNELTERDLADCAWMTKKRLDAAALAPGRRYTFQELRALHDAPRQYTTLYHALQSGNQDYRLKILRQLCKRNLLRFDLEETEIAALAVHLDTKPLDAWMQTDFGHISDLTAGDAVQMLIHLDKLRHLLPGIQTRTEVSLALRNLDTLEQYQTITELKNDLLQTDSDWHALVGEMKLTPEFQERYRENIVRFLCNDGAHIAQTYQRSLNHNQEEAYFRVVKAELMGKLDELKYYEGDLQRELDSPLTARVKTGWRVNLHTGKGGLVVREHDDFFSTMLLGVQPQRTCLAYAGGAYNTCLLSAFDSNKKILYATLDGRVVGRAFLRLTKGRLTGAGAPAEEGTSGFTFVDLEKVQDTRPARTREKEELTLFLEKPYISGVGPAESEQITRLFIELAERKADELDTMLVLSADYRKRNVSGFTWTQYAVYISKSKAGSQYLDSLGGHAEVSSEGSYSSSSFLVRESGTLPLAM